MNMRNVIVRLLMWTARLIWPTSGQCARRPWGPFNPWWRCSRIAGDLRGRGAPDGRLSPPAMDCHDLPPTVTVCHHLPRPVSFEPARGEFVGTDAHSATDDSRVSESTRVRCGQGALVTNGAAGLVVRCLSNRDSRKTLGRSQFTKMNSCRTTVSTSATHAHWRSSSPGLMCGRVQFEALGSGMSDGWRV